MKNAVHLMLLGLLSLSCSDFDDEWRNKEYQGMEFNKLVVVGLSGELERRKIYEEVGREELDKYGIRSIDGLSVFPQKITEKEDNYDTITELIISNKIDAVLTIKVLHERDHKYMMPDDHKRFKVFYGRWGRSKSLHMARGYYKKPEKYYMVATLYDLHEKHVENEETAVWRATDIIMNPAENIEKKKEFIRTSISHLVDQKLILVPQNQ